MERIKQRIYTLVKPCVDFLLSVRYPSGNLPSSLESSNDNALVHWCHGAPGAVHLWGLAYKVSAFIVILTLFSKVLIFAILANESKIVYLQKISRPLVQINIKQMYKTVKSPKNLPVKICHLW